MTGLMGTHKQERTSATLFTPQRLSSRTAQRVRDLLLEAVRRWRIIVKAARMKTPMFRKLVASVREGGAILRGKKKASRRFSIDASGVRAIRERAELSQSEFAALIGVSVKTLQNWEQQRRKPTGPAAA